MEKVFGQHYLVEFIDCNSDKLKFVDDIKPLLLEAAEKSQATVLNNFYHQFEPQGVSAVLMIAESHFSIHTWPQDSYAAFDILTCGKMFPQKAIDFLEKSLEAKKVEVKVVERGF